jgi:hypothetical protein
MADLTFTTIEESARHSLNISRDEYAACNYIQTWASFPSNNTPGFCNRTRGQMAAFIGISERGMQKMLSRLEGMDLIKRASQSQFLYRITEKWFNTVVAAKSERTGEQSSRQGVNKVPTGGEQSSRKGVNKVHPHKELNNEVIRSEQKERFAPPAPAESETVKAEEVKRGMYAPPAEAAAPEIECPMCEGKGGWCNKFTEGYEQCPACHGDGTVSYTAAPTHTVTTIDPAEPGLKVVTPFVMPKRVDTVDEAEEIIMEWAKGAGRESVRKWYADAARQCTAVDVTAMVAKFAGVYLTVSDEGKRQRMAQDPLQFFKYTFKQFLQNEKTFGAKFIPGAPAQSNSPVPTNIRRL